MTPRPTPAQPEAVPAPPPVTTRRHHCWSCGKPVKVVLYQDNYLRVFCSNACRKNPPTNKATAHERN